MMCKARNFIFKFWVRMVRCRVGWKSSLTDIDSKQKFIEIVEWLKNDLMMMMNLNLR